MVAGKNYTHVQSLLALYLRALSLLLSSFENLTVFAPDLNKAGLNKKLDHSVHETTAGRHQT